MCSCNWNFDRKYLDLRMETYMIELKENKTWYDYSTIFMYERYIRYLKMRCRCKMEDD